LTIISVLKSIQGTGAVGISFPGFGFFLQFSGLVLAVEVGNGDTEVRRDVILALASI
jgi:hypothetical protein